jgi:glycosyl transferase, family 25
MMGQASFQKIPIYIINLAQDGERLALMQEQCDRLGLGWDRVEAVDGNKLGVDEINKLNQRATPRKLSPGEIGCLQSHVKVWQQMIQQAVPAALIMEDDVLLSPDLPRFLYSHEWLPEDDCIVRLETFLMPVVLGKKSFETHERMLHPLRSLQYGCAGYIITKTRAKALLEVYHKHVDTADRLMFCNPLSNHVYQLDPALCIQRDIHENGFLEHRLDSGLESGRRDMIKKSKYNPVSFLLRMKSWLYGKINMLIDRARGYPFKVIPYK